MCYNNVHDITSKKHNLKSPLHVLSSLLICADNVIQFKRLIAEEPAMGIYSFVMFSVAAAS